MDKYYAQTREEMINFIPSGNLGKILDIGCGQGIFATLVKDRYHSEVWGVEPVEEHAKKAERVMDTVFHGGFDDAYKSLPNNYFDCIIFNDVLEHMVDPYMVLEKTKSLLNDQGVIVCSIPNVRYFMNLFELLIKKDWRYRDAGVLDRTHLRFFTKKSMRRMFKEGGYAEIQVVGINPLKSKKMLVLYLIANVMSFGLFTDTKFQQYACVMVPDIK